MNCPFQFCPACGDPIEHRAHGQGYQEQQPPKLLGRRVRPMTLEAYETLRLYGPLTCIELRERMDRGHAGMMVEELKRIGAVEVLAPSEGSRWPRYQVRHPEPQPMIAPTALPVPEMGGLY